MDAIIKRLMETHRVSEASYTSGSRYYGGLPAEPSAAEYGQAMNIANGIDDIMYTYDLEGLGLSDVDPKELETGIKVEDTSSGRVPSIRYTGTGRQFYNWSKVVGLNYQEDVRPNLVKVHDSVNESTTGGTIFRTGDVCIYHFKEMSEDIPEETKQYYKDRDGCYCFVTSDDDYHGYIQIRFISDVAKNDNQSAECPPDELEKVGR